MAARQTEASKPPVGVPKPKPLSSTPAHSSAGAKLKVSGTKKEKDRLKGVIVKKKSNPTKHKAVPKEGANVSDNSHDADELGVRELKRRKTDG